MKDPNKITWVDNVSSVQYHSGFVEDTEKSVSESTGLQLDYEKLFSNDGITFYLQPVPVLGYVPVPGIVGTHPTSMWYRCRTTI